MGLDDHGGCRRTFDQYVLEFYDVRKNYRVQITTTLGYHYLSNWQGHAGRSLIIAWQQALPLQNLLHIIDQNEVGLLQGKTGLDKLIKFTPVEVSLTNTVWCMLVDSKDGRESSFAIDRPCFSNASVRRSEASAESRCRGREPHKNEKIINPWHLQHARL